MKYDFICKEVCGIRLVMKDEMWGAIKDNDEEAFPLLFDKMPEIYGIRYLVCEKHGKQGVYDFCGKEVIEAIYDKICYITDDIFCLTRLGENKIIDLESNISYTIDCDSIKAVSKEYFWVKKEEMYGLMNRKGEVLVQIKYKSIKIEFPYVIAKDKKLHIYNLETKSWIAEGKYSKYKVCGPNCICLKKGVGTYIFLDKEGKQKLKTEFNYYRYDEYVGAVIVGAKGKYGVINLDCEQVVPLDYEFVSWLRAKQFVATLNGRQGVINISNNILLQFKYDEIEHLKNEGCYIGIRKDGKVGLLDLEFNVVIPSAYDEIYMFSDKFAKVRLNYKYGLYNLETRKILCDFRYKEIGYFHEGFASVRNEDGLYGYIDENGNEVVSCKYYGVHSFCNGYAVVEKSFMKYGYINSQGIEVTPFIYRSAYDVKENGFAEVEVSVKKLNQDWSSSTRGIIQLF